MNDAEPSIRAADGKRRPAVLQVLPALVGGGVERGTVDVAAALAGAGWRSLVASAGGPMTRELARAGAVHFTLPLASKNPLVMRANIGRLAALIRQHDVDIVHARSRAPAWSARAAAQRTGVHFLTTFHNAYGGRSWFKRRYNAVMAGGELVIANSNFVAEHAVATYGIPRDRIRVIHRGVDVARFDPEKVSAERMARLAQEWRLPDGVPVVMLPGRLSRWKGHFVLVEAMKRLNRPQIHTLVVGGGGGERYRARLAAAIARAGSTVTFRVLDECRDMPAAYMLADVVVSASTEPEGFGRVVVEAQAMGRPVVATAHGGAVETVVAGETGWLVPPGDADALGDAIAEALALDGDGRARLAARAIAHVRGNFTIAAMAARTIAVYQELIGVKPAPATATVAA
ncbi:MAG: glycosyltransferase family 4 protein [Alphaproteobacteria bacterium]|nr:glycosyltransferase family 4 protein [Alphaproteobacteria bacterium]